MLTEEKAQVQIYILSRDRPKFLREAIDSILNQNQSLMKFEIVVSDNSKSGDVSKMISKHYSTKNFKYIKRGGMLSSREHFRLVVSELNSKYAVLFHDDDVLFPNYIKIMSSSLQDNIAAIGCNALVFKSSILNAKIKMHKFFLPKWFNSEKFFLEQYLPGSGGIAPYPSYLYRTAYLKQAFLNIPIKGKHSDVAILSSLLNYGEILWLESPLMYYRVHDSNDSVVESIPDRLALIYYMKSKGIDKNSIKILFFSLVILYY